MCRSSSPSKVSANLLASPNDAINVRRKSHFCDRSIKSLRHRAGKAGYRSQMNCGPVTKRETIGRIDAVTVTPLTLQMRHFVDVVRGKAEPILNGREGTRTLEPRSP
jgi:hypothetical protein